MSKTAFIIVALFLFAAGHARAQQAEIKDRDREQSQIEVAEDTSKVYRIPFASKGNTLELTLANTTGSDLDDITIVAEEVPEWMELTGSKTISSLEPGSEATIRYTFHIAEEAPVGQQADLTIEARAQEFSWNKAISLKVAPPGKFELDPNYPNPFNPATTIRYRLPAEMKVTVNVYNILGRRVVTLADGLQQQAGQQTLRFDGSRLASGMYFFRITAQANGGKKITRLQKMTLIK